MIFPLNSHSQEYQFEKPRNVKMKITIMDHFYTDSARHGDTVSIDYFDGKGNRIRSVGLSKGLLDSETYYSYDHRNRLIERSHIGRLVYGGEDSNGELILVAKQDSILLSIQKYEYNQKGKLKQEDWYTMGKHLEVSYKYMYDEQNRIVEEKQIYYPIPVFSIGFLPNSSEFDPDYKKIKNVQVERTSYKYNKNLRMRERYDSTALKGIDTAFYSNQLIQKEVGYNASGNKNFETKYRYNSKKQLIEFTRNVSDDYFSKSDMLPSSKREYEYNLDGILIKEKEYIDKSTTVRHYKYVK